MSGPQRIQRKRTKGWRMPEGVVYVGRPTRWGNSFAVGGVLPLAPWMTEPQPARRWTPETATAAYRRWLTSKDPLPVHGVDRAVILLTLAELTGRDLACWCPLDQPCHADVLRELANAPARWVTQPGDDRQHRAGADCPCGPIDRGNDRWDHR